MLLLELEAAPGALAPQEPAGDETLPMQRKVSAKLLASHHASHLSRFHSLE